MDPLSHAALGRTLAAFAESDRSRRGVVSVTIAGALSPDLDAVFMPFGWDRYLAVHEIGTHSILGTAACAALVAVAARRFAPDTRWRTLMLAAWAGAVSHVLLDLLSSARIRALWPFVDRQLTIPLVAMADPWLGALLVAGALAIWTARRNARSVALAMLAVSAGFLAIKAVLALQAIGTYTTAIAAGAVPTAYQVQATWAALRAWDVFDRTSTHLRAWHVTAGVERPELRLMWALQPDTAQVAHSRRQPVVRNFLRAHDLAFAVTLPQPDGSARVLWSDIRFCWAADSEPPLEPVVTSEAGRLSCGLWFGVEFDDRGQAVRQVVRIGRFTQARAPAG